MGQNGTKLVSSSSTATLTPTSNDVQKESFEHGFKWKVIPMAIGIAAAITMVALSVLLSQQLQICLGVALFVTSALGVYLAASEPTELGPLDEALQKKYQELEDLDGKVKKATSDFEGKTRELQQASDLLTQTTASYQEVHKKYMERVAAHGGLEVILRENQIAREKHEQHKREKLEKVNAANAADANNANNADGAKKKKSKDKEARTLSFADTTTSIPALSALSTTGSDQLPSSSSSLSSASSSSSMSSTALAIAETEGGGGGGGSSSSISGAGGSSSITNSGNGNE